MTEKNTELSGEARHAAAETQPSSKDETNNHSDDEVDAFSLITSKSSKKKRRRSKRKILNISISSSANDKKDATIVEEPVSKASKSNLDPDYNDDGEEYDGNLSFFSETHEEQDQIKIESGSSHMKGVATTKEQSASDLNAQLRVLEADKKEDLTKVNAYLIAKWEERTDTLNKQVTKIRQNVLKKQNTQRAELAERQKRQQELDKRKIDEGRKWLIERQQQQLRNQEADPPGSTGNSIVEEWSNVSARLQTQHSNQLKQFEHKEATMKERSANDVNAQLRVLEAHHKKRTTEAEQFVDDLIKKCQLKQKNLESRLARLHKQRFETKRREIQTEFSKPTSSEYQSHPGVSQDYDSNSLAYTAAVMRHKRRKHIMNGATVNMAVDIHNEGIFLMTTNTQKNENSLSRFGNVSNTSPGVGTIVSDETSGQPCLFIPWGAKARSFLYSIMCGEIPIGYGLEKMTGSLANQKLLDGGLLKCIITDTRTSDETAVSDRAESYPRIQKLANTSRIENVSKLVAKLTAHGEELESDIKNLSLREQNIAKAHTDATQNLERSKATMDKLKHHFQHFFGKDGTVSPNLNPEGQQKILSTMYRYKASYETSKDEEMALREPLELVRKSLVAKNEDLDKVKKELQKLEGFKKETKSKTGLEINMIDKRAENLINSICQVSLRRRSYVNRKKNNSSESNALSSFSEDGMKSFAQKMARRRSVTMLRSTQASLVNEVKGMVDKSCQDRCVDPKLRAEELLLLSLYPHNEEKLDPIPSDTNTNWAEPGWQLDLSPPKEGNAHSILQVDTESLMPRHSLSVCCSSGRQTAALLQKRHLSLLEGPLSFVCKASAPAEINPGHYRATEESSASDPLSLTDEDMNLGYSFVLRLPKKTSSGTNTQQKSPTKRKSTNQDATTAKKGPKKRRQSQTENQMGKSQSNSKSSSSAEAIAPLQQTIVGGLSPQLMQANQSIQTANSVSNQPMQAAQSLQTNNQTIQAAQTIQTTQPTQVNNTASMKVNQLSLQPNPSLSLQNNNILNQSFMNMSPEQYQWMLQQHQLRIRQQQQQQQQQLQIQQLQPHVSVDQGQTKLMHHSTHQQNNRR